MAPGEVLVRLRPGAGKTAIDVLGHGRVSRFVLLEAQKLFPATKVRRNGKLVVRAEMERWYLLRVDSAESPEHLAADLAGLPQIEYAQANYLRRETVAVDDSLYGEQWSLAEIGWQQGGEMGEVIVAVIDSGIDYEHPDLAGQLWANSAEMEGRAGVDDDGNGYIDDRFGWDFTDAPGTSGEGDFLQRDADPRDESGHGTHVAGIIAAAANGRGMVGVAANARLMVLRAGFNLPGGGYLEDDDVAAAIIYAVDNGARIINMSWGDPRSAPLVRDAVRYAHEAGVVLVAAAGNEGSDAVFYPARFAETIAVGATAPGGEVLAFSNFGPSIDVVAPGHVVLSTVLGGGYGERSGTSMAAPHVAGLAALILGRQPQWQPEQVRAVLRATARDVVTVGWDAFSGAGLIHYDALAVPRPPAAKMVSPAQGSVLTGSSVPVQLALREVGPWELSWGRGTEPRVWKLLAAGEEEVEEGVEAAWDINDEQTGPYQLRLRALWRGRWLEERVAVQIVRQGPAVQGLRWARALDGENWVYVLEWQTEIEARGRLRLLLDGESVFEQTVALGHSQRVVLPTDIEDGDYVLQVRAEAGAALGEWAVIDSLPLRVRSVRRWRFAESIQPLPAGYLLPELSDFNDDGRPELVQMGYGGGLQYNAADFYQFNGEVGTRAFTSLQLYIPWNIQDADADGLLEIMAVDALRVRLFEAPSARAFPSRLAWEQRDVWGGEVADLDGDGLLELLLRSAKGSFFQVFESVADDAYRETAVLNYASEGSNGLGRRQVAADLDGDGRGDLMGGDDDGDVFVFEAVGDNRYRQVWQAEGEGDARLVGGGVDLDGDGILEFVVARFFDDSFDLNARRWQVEVYSATGRDEYALEWQTEILGGQVGGSGLSYGDLDGDGSLEWALVAVPHIYVFTSPEADEYEPIWQHNAEVTFRPLVGDIDGDGRAELAFNADAQVHIVSSLRDAEGVPVPVAFAAYALDRERVKLEWERVAGTTEYRIYRDGVVVAQSVGPFYVDEDVQEERSYAYAVSAVGAGGAESLRTQQRVVSPELPLSILSIERVSAYQLAVVFSAAVENAARAPFRFRVEPDVGIAASAIRDRGQRRLVLGFDQALPDSGVFVLQAQGVRSIRGVPLDVVSREFAFALEPQQTAARLLGVRVDSPQQIALLFDKPVLAPISLDVFSFNEGLLLQSVQAMGEELILRLDEDTALRPLGRVYSVSVAGLQDMDGLSVSGELRFSYAAADLRRARALPNPFFPARGDMTFAFLPLGAEIYIYDVSGVLLRILKEDDGDGGVTWSGENDAGRMLGSGVYYYRILGAGQTKVGKFALVR